MARLNEPAAPMESIELLRKRFLRQNKEIIRANSDQSIKIRTLEAEQSRLLSENITLREENIRLTHELNKGRHALALDNVGAVKNKLQAFASGLGDLLAELAAAHANLPDPQPRHEAAKRRSLKASPGQRRWKSSWDPLDNADQEGKLPPIVEGKFYPRKTLDAAELQATLNGSPALGDSPELGPPPRVQFDMGDPMKQAQASNSPSPSRSRPRILNEETPHEEPQALSVNFEMRKKRRASAFVREVLVPEVEPPKVTEIRLDGPSDSKSESEEAHPVARGSKSGAKRKLSVRDGEETTRDLEDFEYTKKLSGENKRTAELPIRGGKLEKSLPGRKTEHLVAKNASSKAIEPQSKSRRALGEKPVNTDPIISPVKTKKCNTKDSKGDPVKTDRAKNESVKQTVEQKAKPALPTKSKPQDLKPSKEVSKRDDTTSSEHNATVVTHEPATPAQGDDIFSPLALSESSTAREAANRDTPPPADLGGRQSRRSRSAVSYAEPNLRDKMRRPGRELVDAVANDKLKRSMSQLDPLDAGTETLVGQGTPCPPDWDSVILEPAKALVISRHPEEVQHSGLPSLVPAERKRRGSTARSTTESGGDQASASADAGSTALSANNSSIRRLSRAREVAETRNQGEDSINSKGLQATNADDKAVFDFVEGSSPEVAAGERISQARNTRRISSVPEKLGKGGKRRETMASNASLREKLSGVESNSGSNDADVQGERAMTRRRSMML